jgi:hypoxanthine-DNA glycosylase
METKSFDYIANENSKVLILGTMPGIASISANEYYGHPDNLFWDIIHRVCLPDWQFENLTTVSYEEKKQLLLKNKIALWDVLSYCERKGSLDKNIRNKIHNNLELFLQNHQNIKTIFFNGKDANKYFLELEGSILKEKELIILQSTSPSNTKNSFFILNQWQQIRNYIKN